MDASAVLSFLKSETGHDVVRKHLYQSTISAINVGEVLSKQIAHGMSLDKSMSQLARLRMRVVPHEYEHAVAVASLHNQAKQFGLSYADKACLGLAMLEQRPVLTADRSWANMDIGVELTLIR